MLLLICDLLVNSNNLIGPLLTSYDHRSQMYISNVISSSILCIHAKNGVLGCCQRCIIKYFFPLKSGLPFILHILLCRILPPVTTFDHRGKLSSIGMFPIGQKKAPAKKYHLWLQYFIYVNKNKTKKSQIPRPLVASNFDWGQISLNKSFLDV